MPQKVAIANPYANEEYAIYLGLHRLLNDQHGIIAEDPITLDLFELIHPIGTHRLLQEMTRCLCICKRLEPVTIVEKLHIYE
jgi:hypothetical protein